MEPCAALVSRSQSALDTNRDVALICWGLVGVQPTWPCTLFTLFVVMQRFLLFKSGSASLFPTRCLRFLTRMCYCTLFPSGFIIQVFTQRQWFMLFCNATESVYNNTDLGGDTRFFSSRNKSSCVGGTIHRIWCIFFIQSYYYYRYFVFFFKNIFVSEAVFPGVNHRGRKCSVMTLNENSPLCFIVCSFLQFVEQIHTSAWS